MPDLRLSEERLNPHLALAHCFLVRLGGVVAAHLVQILRVKRAMDDPAAAAFGALRLERAGITGRSMSPVDDHVLGVLDPLTPEWMAFRAAVFICCGVIGE